MQQWITTITVKEAYMAICNRERTFIEWIQLVFKVPDCVINMEGKD